MHDISVQSFDELLQHLKSVDIWVPARGDGRSTEDCERWSICRFLSTYSDTELVGYPLGLTKRERPDFLLRIPGREIGIEVTEATPPDWAWVDAKRQKLKYDTSILLERFRPGEPRRTMEEINSIATGAGSGSPWAGDSVEKDWAEVMRHFSLEKAGKATKPGYQHFAANWLLICDNWPLPALDERPLDSLWIGSVHAMYHYRLIACLWNVGIAYGNSRPQNMHRGKYVISGTTANKGERVRRLTAPALRSRSGWSPSRAAHRQRYNL